MSKEHIPRKNRFPFAMFLLALIFGFVLGVLEAYSSNLQRLVQLGQSLYYYRISFANGLYLMIVRTIQIAINPVLILIVFYLVGRKIDLRASLPLLIVSLIAGAYVGRLFGLITATLIMFRYDVPVWLLRAVYMSLNPTFLQAFFVAFTALAIAYIRRGE